jgi:hypothetical protein
VNEVRQDTGSSRYEVLVDGDVAGFAAYQLYEGSYVFDHTVIKDEYAGRGLGTVLARGALDDVRAQGMRMVPLCEFFAGWLGKHPEYDDVVDHDLLARIEASAN